MARVTVEDCVDKVESPYELVLVAKERATQLNAGIEPTIDSIKTVLDKNMSTAIIGPGLGKNFDKEISYTSTLLADKKMLARKIGEESTEVILEYLDNNRDKIIKESSDLLYHLSVMWISANVKLDDVWDELQKRKGMSGLDEKKNRLS